MQYFVVVNGYCLPEYNFFLPVLSPARRELHSDCLALLQAPHIQEQAQLTLPLDINNFPFYRYVQIHFKVSFTLPVCQSFMHVV